MEKKKTSTMLTNAIKNREIPLQSAVVSLKNPAQKQIQAKIIIDTGSQRSYKSQKVRRYLILKTIRTKETALENNQQS